MDIGLQVNSDVTINYSLSDLAPLSGDFNLYADPELVDPESGNFNLLETSPCIDAGDPLFPFDPDSSRVDIGANYFQHENSVHETESGFYLYPNPVSGEMIIETNSNALFYVVTITDLLGKKIIISDILEGKINQLNTVELKTGVYILCIVNSKNEVIFRTKVVKK